VRYTVDPEFWLRAAAYAGFRAPTLNELHRPFRVGNDITEANPKLRPEKLNGSRPGSAATASRTGSSPPSTINSRTGDQCDAGVGPGTILPVAGFIPAGGTLRQRRTPARSTPMGSRGRLGRHHHDAELAGGLRLHPRPGRRRFERAATHASAARPDAGMDGDRRPRLAGDGEADAERQCPLFGPAIRGRSEHPSPAAGRRLNARAAWSVAPDAEVYLAVDNAADAKISTGKTADFIDSYSEPRRSGWASRIGGKPRPAHPYFGRRDVRVKQLAVPSERLPT